MRLPIGRPARHRGAHTRCELGIEKIDIEADMQYAIAGLNPLDEAADQHADAEFIDLTHVRHADAALVQQILFEPVDRARPEQLQPVGVDRRARLFAQ